MQVFSQSFLKVAKPAQRAGFKNYKKVLKSRLKCTNLLKKMGKFDLDLYKIIFIQDKKKKVTKVTFN